MHCVICEVNHYMMKWSSCLSLYSFGSNFSNSCIEISQPKNTHISLNQHETILADLNWYMGTMRLVTILTDDAMKHICIWPLVWCNKYKPYNSSILLQWFLLFQSPVKKKGMQWRMKGFIMAQWINLDRNNRSVVHSKWRLVRFWPNHYFSR